jgi:hypothetical protein
MLFFAAITFVAGIGCRNPRFMVSFRSYVAVAHVALTVLIGASAVASSALAERGVAHQPEPLENSKFECTAQVANFVTRLDELLADNPRTVSPFLGLLSQFFPITGCNIEEVMNVCARSKYFIRTSDNVVAVVFLFSNEKFYKGLSFTVSFSVDKMSGNTRFPSVRPNRWTP